MRIATRRTSPQGDAAAGTRLETREVIVELAGQRIVHEVNLCLEAGEIVGLLGPNGSGKSTLLRTIYRMIRPLAGDVLLNGDEVWKLSARESARRTGVVVQESPTDFLFTVREVVHMGRTPQKGMLERETHEDEQIVTHALERVQMLDFAEREYLTLSGGEKQRVLVARALAQQPKLFVLDEPTNHLDIHHQLELLELIRGLGMTTLLTLHDLNLAVAYCHRLYLLSGGQIVAQGTPEQALTPEIIQQVFHVRAAIGTHPLTGGMHLFLVPLPEGKEEKQ
jgi:iron complex transport system ATP-binding protein